MTIEYRVEEATGLIVKGDDVKDWETIPAWQVQRVETNMAWVVAKYRDKESADAVRKILDLFSSEEAP